MECGGVLTMNDTQTELRKKLDLAQSRALNAPYQSKERMEAVREVGDIHDQIVALRDLKNRGRV